MLTVVCSCCQPQRIGVLTLPKNLNLAPNEGFMSLLPGETTGVVMLALRFYALALLAPVLICFFRAHFLMCSFQGRRGT
jgi:hypothetical protein